MPWSVAASVPVQRRRADLRALVLYSSPSAATGCYAPALTRHTASSSLFIVVHHVIPDEVRTSRFRGVLLEEQAEQSEELLTQRIVKRRDPV